MKKNLCISGLGQISATGQGIKNLQKHLEGNFLPEVNFKKIKTVAGEQQVPGLLTPEVTIPSFIPDAVARRMSRLSRMCFAAVDEALTDCFSEAPRTAERMGLVVGSAYGSLDLANSFGERVQLDGIGAASPSLFASSVQNSIASHLSITFNIQGPASTIMTVEQTTMAAFRQAYDWIQEDIVDHVIVVIGDEISEYHSYFMAHAESDGSLNFKSDICTAMMGEGAVCFIISNLACTAKSYAEITDIRLADEMGEIPARASKNLIASYGQKNQYSQYQKYLGLELKLESHLRLYGSVLMGGAFEVLFAALLMKTDQVDRACYQLTSHGLMQSIYLK
ncbi:MAG: beta-ketoacyl synthase chain length factor [Bdellovibrionaceae bacterium]|nr:beta-ketoacyl synthase chain length factor [Bdellovibrio sp.]